jgi:hypothetical protein
MSYSIPRLSHKTPVCVIAVQRVANPLCTYMLYCVTYSVVYLRTEDHGMITSVHKVLYT